MTRQRLLFGGLLVLLVVMLGLPDDLGGSLASTALPSAPPYFPLSITPPPDAHFEIPFWVVPGGQRLLTVTTHCTYSCYTALNPLTDSIQLAAPACTLVSADYVHTGSGTAIDWGRNYNGIFTQHVIHAFGSDRLLALSAGENKNEYLGDKCKQDGECYQNTVITALPCPTCSSGSCGGVHYSDCWESYNGFINMSWQYYDAAHHWGLEAYHDEGPIVWPVNGYTFGGSKSSNGVRHPHGIVAQGYVWVFYEDSCYTDRLDAPCGERNLQYGIRVARAPVSSGGLPGNWKTYCDGMWVDSLPAGFDRSNMSAFYGQRGGCASPILPTGGYQFSFAVAERVQGGYIGVEERADQGTWSLRLWTSPDLIRWTPLWSLLPTPGLWNEGELHYPVFLSDDGWRSDRVDAKSFYLIGTKDGMLRAMHVRVSGVFLPVVARQ